LKRKESEERKREEERGKGDEEREERGGNIENRLIVSKILVPPLKQPSPGPGQHWPTLCLSSTIRFVR
jgi:hypothetical protein